MINSLKMLMSGCSATPEVCNESEIDPRWVVVPKPKYPLCYDPYCHEIKSLVDELQAEAKLDKSLAFNNFTDPITNMTDEQIALNSTADFWDKSKKLPGGPLLWPAGFPEPGYKPAKNYLTGHYIKVSGTGKPDPSMFIKITQHGDDVTFDASVKMFKRAKRTWRSGNYVFDYLRSGDSLFGVWVVESDTRLVGFYYSMNTGRCMRIERRLVQKGRFTFLRQSADANGRTFFSFFVKVNDESGSIPLPIQSRNYTCLCGLDNVPTNTGTPYPCIGVDLDPHNRWEEDMVNLRGVSEQEMLEREQVAGGTLTPKPEYIGFAFADHEKRFQATKRENCQRREWGKLRSWSFR